MPGVSAPLLRGAAILAVLAVVFGLGWGFGRAQVQRSFAEYKQAQSDALVDAQQKARDAEADARDEINQIDQRHTQELADAQDEIDSLRADLDSGTRGVHVDAYCPDVSGDSEAAGVDDAEPAQLTGAAGQRYLDFRARYQQQRRQLIALQEYLRVLLAEQDGN